MTIQKKLSFKKKLHKREMDLISSLVHPEDGDQRRRYIKRILYGEVQKSKREKI